MPWPRARSRRSTRREPERFLLSQTKVPWLREPGHLLWSGRLSWAGCMQDPLDGSAVPPTEPGTRNRCLPGLSPSGPRHGPEWAEFHAGQAVNTAAYIDDRRLVLIHPNHGHSATAAHNKATATEVAAVLIDHQVFDACWVSHLPANRANGTRKSMPCGHWRVGG